MDRGTGWAAVARRLVTVVARTAVAADALSTAALVSAVRPRGVLDLISVG
jgi:thiamine biosynthesis lipoprotein ApbE